MSLRFFSVIPNWGPTTKFRHYAKLDGSPRDNFVIASEDYTDAARAAAEEIARIYGKQVLPHSYDVWRFMTPEEFLEKEGVHIVSTEQEGEAESEAIDAFLIDRQVVRL